MTNRFLISVAAAALLAGTGFANAQGGGMKSEGGAGSTYQQNAPSPGGGAATQQRKDTGMKSGQSDRMGSGKQAEDQQRGQKTQKGMKAEGRDKDKSGTVGQAPGKSGATTQREDRMGREGKEGKSGTVGQAPDKSGAPMKGREEKGGAATQTREDRMNAPGQKGQMDSGRAQGAQTGSQTTTGMAPAAPPPEKRSQITTAIRSEKIEDVGAKVNVNVSVGTRLPATVRFHPLPPRIVEIYPEWRGYQVVLIKGRYVIVRPRTHEIVYIIEG